jgi:hypothetical protein
VFDRTAVDLYVQKINEGTNMNTCMYLVPGVSEDGASHLEKLGFFFFILFTVQGFKNTTAEHSISGTESVSVPGVKLLRLC